MIYPFFHKTPGVNGISPNTIKALNDKNKNTLFEIYSYYFNNNPTIEE